VWLDVREGGAEQAFQPVDGEPLDDVDVLAPAVVPAAGVALGVLVREHRALCLHHGEWGEVLAGDHLQRGLLPPELRTDRGMDFRVHLGEAAVEGEGCCPAAVPGLEHLASDLSHQGPCSDIPVGGVR
jgi:hypothetical protein